MIDAVSGAVLDELTAATDPDGYAGLVAMADRHSGLRAWSIEGTGGYGAGLTRFLTERGEIVIELDRPNRPARRNGATSDPLDAVRAGREALAREHLAQPRSWRPDLLDQLGIGPIVAATVLCAWSHPGRCRNEAAFASLAGVAPIPASSGLTVRHRLNRCGDRQLNRALHVIVLSRLRDDPTTRAYADRRRAEGKTDREIKRCLKRYIARQLYRQLEQPLDAS